MKTWVDRAKELMRTQKINQEQLAEMIGVTQGAVGHYLHGRRTPPFKRFKQIAEALGVTPKILQYGYAEENFQSTEIREIPLSVRRIPLLKWTDIENLAKDNHNQENPPLKSIVQTLKQKEAEGEVLMIYFDKQEIQGRNLAAIIIDHIDAMVSPIPHQWGLIKNDKLIIDFDEKPRSGDLVLVELNKRFTIRQFIQEAGKNILKALNPQYPIIEDKFIIYGTVIKLLREREKNQEK